MRPPKFESQDESSPWVLHMAHSPRVFLSNGLIDRLILNLVVFETHRKALVSLRLLEGINTRFLETMFFCHLCRNRCLNCQPSARAHRKVGSLSLGVMPYAIDPEAAERRICLAPDLFLLVLVLVVVLECRLDLLAG